MLVLLIEVRMVHRVGGVPATLSLHKRKVAPFFSQSSCELGSPS